MSREPGSVVLSLGGNVGDVPRAFRQAQELLENGGFRVEKVSSLFRTSPVDCPAGTPDFLNIAVLGQWNGTPEGLLDLAQKIEAALGRPADHGYHLSRTLDVDIVWMAGVQMRTPRLTVPHPAASERRFVLDPVWEIAPEISGYLTGLSDRVDPVKILDFYYPEENPLRTLLLKHSMQVRDKALQILSAHPELGLDQEVTAAAAMLHDIGVGLCHAPGICCMGEADYLQHGLLGGDRIRAYGKAHRLDLEHFARVSERHTGSGITVREIRDQRLPLPERDLLPETMLEKLICYADKFFSKSGDMQEKDLEKVRKGMSKFGSDSLARFDELHRLFG